MNNRITTIAAAAAAKDAALAQEIAASYSPLRSNLRSKMKISTSGWRTHAACVVLVLFGVAEAFGYHIPSDLITIICGLGGIAMRAAITNNAKKTTEDAMSLIKSISEKE